MRNSPKYTRQFHRLCPIIPEPPQLILTYWGTWSTAAFYYQIFWGYEKDDFTKRRTKNSEQLLRISGGNRNKTKSFGAVTENTTNSVQCSRTPMIIKSCLILHL